MLEQEGKASTQDGSMEGGTSKPLAGGILRPFTVRNFNLLFGGQTVSVIGDALYAVALPWLILTHGGNAQELGMVLAAYGIPRAGSILVGGWLSDRLRPRRLMLIADLVRTLLVGILAALALGGHPTLWQLCAVAVPLGAFGGAFMPASTSILPDLLSNDDLQAGNALIFSSMQGATLVGSAIAGVLVAAFTADVALAIDALTFAVSALSLALMREAYSTTHSTSGEGARHENPEAGMEEQGPPISFWRYLGASRLLQVTLLLFIVFGLCSGGLVEVALPTLVHGPMHGGASGYGLILAAWGAGALVGSLLAGTLGEQKHKGLMMLLDGMIMAASIALLPTGGVAFAVVCMLVGGVAGSLINVVLFAAIQLAIPRHLLGRVMGVLLFSSFGVYPISVALAGVLAHRFGPAILFPLGGLLIGLVMLFGMTQRALRTL
jgi:MFS family permease